MTGWLVQVPVKRFATEPIVHLHAVWLPDQTDALAAVERRAEERPELLVELSDGTLAGLGLSRGEVCRIHAQS
jgi:uncharacterized protein YjiS (DUF1127 family)